MIRAYGPDRVDEQVDHPVLIQPKQAENHKDNVEKIAQNGQPHVAQKVEDLPLKGGDEGEHHQGALAGPGHVIRLHDGGSPTYFVHLSPRILPLYSLRH